LIKAGAGRKLVEADAFSSCALDRRQSGWKAAALRDAPLPLFEAAERNGDGTVREVGEETFVMPPMSRGREVVEDYVALGLSLKDHPLSLMRTALKRKGCVTSEETYRHRPRTTIRLAGIVLSRQRPGSAKGVMFLTLEDETGPANIIVWPSLFETYRSIVLSAGMIGVEGEIQREGQVLHIVAKRLVDLSHLLEKIGNRENLSLPFGRGDEARSGGGPDQRVHGKQGRILPKPTEDFNKDFDHRTILGEPDRPAIKIKARNFR
jgi:error-prone DNA polymerase